MNIYCYGTTIPNSEESICECHLNTLQKSSKRGQPVLSGLDVATYTLYQNIIGETGLNERERKTICALRSYTKKTKVDEYRLWNCILRGGYCVIEGEELYEKLKKIEGCYKRISSHKSDGEQYGIPLKNLGECLFSFTYETQDDGFMCRLVTRTWVQFERHSLNDPLSIIGHGIDWIWYVLTGENQGPRGSIEYTEKKNSLIFSNLWNHPMNTSHFVSYNQRQSDDSQICISNYTIQP